MSQMQMTQRYDDLDPETSRPTDVSVLHGHVKWFDPTKGFGFVVSDTGGPDILLHANVLRAYGQGTVADGAAISLRVQKTDRGMQASEVVSITPVDPGAAGAPVGPLSEVDPALIASLPLRPARVKWFDKGKGFGFAQLWGEDGDVFLHVEVLRRSGLADLLPGEGVALRSIQGKRGALAVEIVAWEAGLREAPQT